MSDRPGLVTTGIIWTVPGVDDKLELIHELRGAAGAPAGLFVARVVERGLEHVATGTWATASRSLAGVQAPLHRVRGEGTEHVLAERDGTLVHVALFSGWIQAEVAGDDPDRAADVLGELKSLFPAPDPSSTHKVGVQFWTYGRHGPFSSYREISVPSGLIWPTTTARRRATSSTASCGGSDPPTAVS